MRRKSQAALEYLVTYGWALIAIIIIMAVLWYLGLFNPTQFSNPAGKECGGFSTIQCIDYTTTGGNAISIVFGNAAGANIQSVNATLKGITVSCASIVQSDGRFTCSFNATSYSDKETIPVEIVYASSLSSLVHNETGFVKAFT